MILERLAVFIIAVCADFISLMIKKFTYLHDLLPELMHRSLLRAQAPIGGATVVPLNK